MLWAIDVGNTQTVVGVYDGNWCAVWRVKTDPEATEDELFVLLTNLANSAGVPPKPTQVAIASVVPQVDFAWGKLCQAWTGQAPWFLRTGRQVGMAVDYDPPHGVGADRIANAFAAIRLVGPPCLVVDFGTATTVDCVGPDGAYVGGSIMPGVLVSCRALAGSTAKLPPIALKVPGHAIGKTTVDALESGVMFGYAGAVDTIVERIKSELPGVKSVIATGGLAKSFMGLCRSVDRLEPNLTLDGVRLSFEAASTLGG